MLLGSTAIYRRSAIHLFVNLGKVGQVFEAYRIADVRHLLFAGMDKLMRRLQPTPYEPFPGRKVAYLRKIAFKGSQTTPRVTGVAPHESAVASPEKHLLATFLYLQQSGTDVNERMLTIFMRTAPIVRKITCNENVRTVKLI